jgi:endonuclease YncB( thermonuclease family)
MMKFTGHLLRWVDGDTAIVEVDLGFKIWRKIRVRLDRINSPEMNSKSSYERRRARSARAFANRNFPPSILKEIEIETKSRDKYGRWISQIFWGKGKKAVEISIELLKNDLFKEVEF